MRCRPSVLLLLVAAWLFAGCGAITTADTTEAGAPNEAREPIPISVTRPLGDGPFPAVVVMHDCSGLGPSSSHARPEGPGFAAAVALYPACRVRLGGGWNGLRGVYQPVAPLLILIGALDDWTPAEPCRQMVEASRAAGFPIAIKIYPGAHHSFDSANPVRYVGTRINPNAPGGRGATAGGNAEAWADSVRKVLAFFARHLATREATG